MLEYNNASLDVSLNFFDTKVHLMLKYIVLLCKLDNAAERCDAVFSL